jgi:energy-coupling factor transporter ATP-binding protein EcfA2
MKLASFRATDFRSINDSTQIEVRRHTALVGRNESGKSSLLKVLHGLNPAGDMPVFTLARDFPRDRPRKDFDGSLRVVTTRWLLSDEDRAALGRVWPRGATATEVDVTRRYDPKRTVGFVGESDLEDGRGNAASAARDLARQIKKAAAGAGAIPAPVVVAADALDTAVASTAPLPTWAASVAGATQALRAALSAASVTIKPPLEAHLATIEAAASSIQSDEERSQNARNWIVANMPTFVYLDEWDVIPGHHNIDEYLARKKQGSLRPEDVLFEKLLKVAELDAAELQKLLAEGHEERKLLTNRAGRVLTKTLRTLWKDREVTVDFNVDAGHFDVLVSDKDTNALVPLDERSRGFRWYFSFFICFAADTQGGDKANAVLLLDEPGLFLHATAQNSLLRFFDTLPNQILYTTHSPFMIDSSRLEDVRTVNLRDNEGTVVTGDPTGDANTLFPLQAALGYDLTQTLFVGSRNVVVEGVTDYWFLTTVADYLAEKGRRCIDVRTVLTPAGGAPKISYMVALLTAQRLNVAVLFDSEPQAELTAKELLKAKLIRPEGLAFVGAAFEHPPTGGADIEDLIEPTKYLALVQQAYAKELAGRTLPLNPAIPRIVRRVEDAFSRLGLEFHKTRAAKLFVRKMADAPGDVLDSATEERFARLLSSIESALIRIEAAGRGPFA